MRYPVVLLHDPEINAFVVLVPDLPGCFSQGNTIEDALEHAREAIELHIEGLVDDGEEVPQPTASVVLATVEVSPAVTVG